MSFFVAFEGPDGSGKSTQIRLLVEALRTRGDLVEEAREPGGTAVGEAVRDLLLTVGGPAMSPLTMALLLSASRAQLVSDVIAPALHAGKTVIVDRYTDSTLAYQGYGLGLDAAVVDELSHIATGGLAPDVSVYIDVPIEVGLKRAGLRAERNRLDAADIAFHRRVREGYLRTIRENPARWITVDGTLPSDQVHRAVLDGLAPFLGEVAQIA